MTVGRPLGFDPEIALTAAMQLFWRRGYESSSLQDLLSTMALSKSSFYQAFKSKHNLFQRCLLQYRKALDEEMKTRLEQAGSGRAFIETLFHDIAKETAGRNARRGCLLMNTASEFAQIDTKIAGLVSDSISQLTDTFESAIQLAQRDGEIEASKDSRTLAIYLVSSMSGLKNMVKAGADRETIGRIVDMTLKSLD